MATYDNHVLIKVRNYAKHKYSPFRIATLLGLSSSDSQEFLDDIQTPDHPLKNIYELGIALGEYNMDVSLEKQATDGDMDAELQLRQRQKEMKIRELKKELFGV